MNLADLPLAQREQIEADKAACLIRYKCKGLKGAARQDAARRLLAALPNAEAVKLALEVRANASSQQKTTR
jgi:hypothetical protein